jgi:hypothetical protein
LMQIKFSPTLMSLGLLSWGKVVILSPNRENAKNKQIRMIKTFIFTPYPYCTLNGQEKHFFLLIPSEIFFCQTFSSQWLLPLPMQ